MITQTAVNIPNVNQTVNKVNINNPIAEPISMIKRCTQILLKRTIIGMIQEWFSNDYQLVAQYTFFLLNSYLPHNIVCNHFNIIFLNFKQHLNF